MTSSLLLLFFLIALVVAVQWTYARWHHAKLFRIIPVPFWCYFLPMVATSLGIIPDHSILYDTMGTYLLPAALILILVGADLPSLAQLGSFATIMMLTGSFGTILGGILTFLAFRPLLPDGSWMGIGAMCATWIGGSANMLAVKEALHIPESIFTPLILTDTILSYTWMGILIALAGLAAPFDRWNRSKVSLLRLVRRKIQPRLTVSSTRVNAVQIGLMLGLALLMGTAALALGKKLPEWGYVLSHSTWGILLATTFALVCSLTPIRRLEEWGASSVGYFCLFLLLASIGAKANLRTMAHAPLFLAMGCVWLLIHASVLFAVGRWLKSPLFFLATASQANIGGPASAPIVAAVFERRLAVVGLLMAILGNVFGTYLGLATAELCRILAG